MDADKNDVVCESGEFQQAFGDPNSGLLIDLDPFSLAIEEAEKVTNFDSASGQAGHASGECFESLEGVESEAAFVAWGEVEFV
jgi:hypothetical protein